MPGSGLILGIETSCDETAAAVVERGARTLSSVVASQIATHARYGGVVPELASREHLRAIVPVVRAALAEARLTLADLDAIAVTSGPGLAGALLVGITYAKALAFANNLPLISVNHLEGHIHAVLLQERESAAHAQNKGAPDPGSLGTGLSPWGGGPDFEIWDSANLKPSSALALVVSGGHTHLFLARPASGAWSYTLIGRTVDDAAGEAFDKVAKLLGLGYPGGPWIDALAPYGNPHAVPFSFAQIKTKAHLGGKPARTKAARTAPIARLDPHFLFSFSGIKTAVLRYVDLHSLRAESKARVSRVLANFRPPQTREEALVLCPQPTLDLIASFQHAVVGDLMKKTFAAAESLGAKRILVTGGVAANRELRARFAAEADRRALRIAFPTLALSTDNAAMIAAAAWPRLLAQNFAPPDLTADPSLALS
ncbi:MAG: tRNA (adenosine(37)-N6)-threonylcarbamoyltransferase complex transferase subunit TsaD [Terracidiphilus sp.]|jgi:N6-L-threonylcarbamoyladenine synthase